MKQFLIASCLEYFSILKLVNLYCIHKPSIIDLIIIEIYVSEKPENIFYINLGLIIKQNDVQFMCIYVIKKT